MQSVVDAETSDDCPKNPCCSLHADHLITPARGDGERSRSVACPELRSCDSMRWSLLEEVERAICPGRLGSRDRRRG
jgi:hypothetical protein